MIKANDSHVMVAGTPIDIMQDFVNITRAVRGVLTEKTTEDRADEIISLCGRIAYCEDDETEATMYLDRLIEVMNGAEAETNS